MKSGFTLGIVNCFYQAAVESTNLDPLLCQLERLLKAEHEALVLKQRVGPAHENIRIYALVCLVRLAACECQASTDALIAHLGILVPLILEYDMHQIVDIII